MTALPTRGSLFKSVAAPSFSTPIRISVSDTPAPESCVLDRFGSGLSRALGAQGADVCLVAPGSGEHVAILQHDFRFHPDSDSVVETVGDLSTPSVVVIHTVPKSPTKHQYSIIKAIAARSDQLVVMSEAAARALVLTYDADPNAIAIIPHGASVTNAPRIKRPSRPTILTWGWLAPGDGIERIIDVMSALAKAPGRPRYLVAGPTHPAVLAAEGERYREALLERIRRNGVADSVALDPRSYIGGSLTTLFHEASVVAVPYDSTDVMTSALLVEAVARGRPVVATAFPQALELVNGSVGIVVDYDDPAGLTTALRRIITQPRLSGAMAAEARRLAPDLDWPVVAAAYVRLARHVLAQRRSRS